jgi:hypothetical protein
MNITIVNTVNGSEDGIHLRPYYAGQSYLTTDRLGRNLIAGGLAVLTPEREPESVVSRDKRASAKSKRR